MEWKERVRTRFSKSADADKWVEIYTSNSPNVEAVSFRKRSNFTISYILENIPEGSIILDLGCGAGPVLAGLVEKNYKLIGLDYSADMLIRARITLAAKGDSLPLLVGDCEKVPMPDSSIDCIICLGVISYAKSVKAALNEQYRILKPGGRVIISYRNMLNPILTDPIKLIRSLGVLLFTSRKNEHKEIGRTIARSEILGCIKNQNFTIVTEHQIGFGNIRLNGRVISDGRLAIRVNKLVHNFLSYLKLKAVYRAIADIHIFILEKPA